MRYNHLEGILIGHGRLILAWHIIILFYLFFIASQSVKIYNLTLTESPASDYQTWHTKDVQLVLWIECLMLGTLSTSSMYIMKTDIWTESNAYEPGMQIAQVG